MSARLNTFVEIKSSVKSLPEASGMVEAIRAYDYVLQHTLDGVAMLKAADYQALPEDLLELRAFSTVGELHAVAVEDGFVGRVRTDGDGEDAQHAVVFDEEHLVWGYPTYHDGKTVLFAEDRGTQVRVPSCIVAEHEEEFKGGNRLTILVRNYLDEGGVDTVSGDTRFEFCDYRLVEFKVREAEKHGQEV